MVLSSIWGQWQEGILGGITPRINQTKRYRLLEKDKFWPGRKEFTLAPCGELPGAWCPFMGSSGLLTNSPVKHRGIKRDGGERILLLSLPSMNSSIDCHWVISMGRWCPVWMQVTAASQKKGNGELAPPRRRGEKSPDPAWTYFVFWKGRALSPRFTGCSDRQEIKPWETFPVLSKWRLGGHRRASNGSVNSQNNPPTTNEYVPSWKKKKEVKNKTERFLLSVFLCLNRHVIYSC